MAPLIEVKPSDTPTQKERWGLYVNGIMIGDAKARFDADHAKVMLEKALATDCGQEAEL